MESGNRQPNHPDQDVRLVNNSPQRVSSGTDSPGLGSAGASLVDNVWNLPGVIIDDSSEIIQADNNLLWLLAAGGGSIALNQSGADRKIDDNLNKHSWVGDHKDLDRVVDLAGNPGMHFAASGLWYLFSASGGDRFNRDRAGTMIEALAVNGAATMALKLIVHDRTPNDKLLAWPSGHTSSSFTVAAVLDEYYGPGVGIPAYLGAGFVGYRMMDSGDHWASDVLFGGVLGYIVGHHVAGKHVELELAGFEVLPYTGSIGRESVVGLQLIKNW